MTKMVEIATRAFRKAGIGGMGEALSAEMTKEGIDALNAMLHGWKLRGVDIEHTTLEAGGTFPLAAEYEEGTVYLLASRLAPDFMMPVGFDADDWFRGIQAAYMTITAATIPLGLRKMPSQYANPQRARSFGS